MGSSDREEEEVFLNPPSVNKLSFLNLLRWYSFRIFLAPHRHFHAMLGKAMSETANLILF